MGRIYAEVTILSTPLPFKRKYWRHSVNIQHCFTLERKSRLSPVVDTRPWAAGLSRLLADRRGLKKGVLAEIADVRPALISAVLNSATPPDVKSLQRLAEGLTKYDRKLDPRAPAVEMWEFFVSDEQAVALHERAEKTRQPQVDERLLEQFGEFLKQRGLMAPAPAAQAETTNKKKHG